MTPTAWKDVEAVGAPTRCFVNVERYRFGTTDVRNPAFYPIPQDPVTRDTYLRRIEEIEPAEIARHPNQGMEGPRAFLPVLIKYVQTDEAAWGDACIAMLERIAAIIRTSCVSMNSGTAAPYPTSVPK